MKVLVLTLSFGSGHVQAAHTVARELLHQEPDAEVRVVDALAGSRRLFRAGYVWPYWAMLRYAPRLWDRFFTRRVARMEQHTAPEWAFRWGCSHVFKAIEEFRPDSVVAAEVAACEMASMAKRDGLTRARLINVITDYEAEPVWVKPEVDVYAVADEHVRRQLCEWGVADERIKTSGIPADRAFRIRHDAKATRRRYGIVDDDRPVVLLMGGGMGPTRMDEVAAKLCESREAMHVVAVTGHDSRAERRLARLRALPPATLHVLGWTDDIAALMRVSSLLLTKPGGLTLAEAAICALPVVMFDPIPGPERRNSARLVDVGAGLLTHGPGETVSAALSLLRDEGARRGMSACAEQLARPDAATMIAGLALDQPVLNSEFVRRRMTA